MTKKNVPLEVKEKEENFEITDSTIENRPMYCRKLISLMTKAADMKLLYNRNLNDKGCGMLFSFIAFFTFPLARLTIISIRDVESVNGNLSSWLTIIQ